MADTDRQQEQTRVDQVMDEIHRQLAASEETYQAAHAETGAIQKNYADNASVNTFEVDDAMETNAELQQQRQLVYLAVTNEETIGQQLDNLKALDRSAYFGRIDIKDAGDTTSDQLYIGTFSLTDADQNFLIYDWRAPIASIYYNGTLGQVHYQTPAGKQTTELTKKRQFTIKNGTITNMFDTNETVGDEMLQAVLGEQNDAVMQNIVATIQKEQNDIIRDTAADLLVVQGVAGSGKTSAILQRIAYLLYHSRNGGQSEIAADQMILFSPNRLFSHYISEVLPSLGERNMRQVTLDDFLTQRLQGLHVQTLFERYEDDATTTDHATTDVRDYLESTQLMADLSTYSRSVSVADLRFNDILLDGSLFFTKEAIAAIYAEQPATMSTPNRFLATKNTLIKQLKRRIKTEAQADWVATELDNLDTEHYHDLLGDRLGTFKELDDEMAFAARAIVRRRFSPIYEALFNNYFLDIYRQYDHFLQTTAPESVDATNWSMHEQDFDAGIEYHRIDLADSVPLLYLRDLITGGGQNRSIAYVFVDEMQDYSLAQMCYIKHAFPKAKFTLLGDSEQALFNHLQTPQELVHQLADAFQAKRPNLITLNRSYRSTMPITNFAKGLLPDGEHIQAFNRPGDLPQIRLRKDTTAAITATAEVAAQELATYGTVAILTKNVITARSVYRDLHAAHLPVSLLNDADRTLPKGVVIMPVYLAKGLEFDAVVAYDVSSTNYPSDDAIGILYTMASRAMHHLTLISVGDASPVISHADPKLLKIEHEF
ncbi:RNA polymerase recycling motor HelD [Furfurilactobacillus siliginis]|uniref:DNA helicase n=1 Tax=Furfurilactobacillus siliginis TaxID=348151 RepID=A0A0R2L2V1_9LACO|nr:RNA polymerase recycling motor HelD [Furfurilactobacillus siliginis]KRN96003.1 dna helicase [Furfurilactobacillus siliginis]GEK28818.1 DNA helicase [Furfurilactobacillus siliginis]